MGDMDPLVAIELLASIPFISTFEVLIKMLDHKNDANFIFKSWAVNHKKLI